MGLFSKIKHAFHNIGHAVEHAAKDIVHGIEHVAKDIGHAAHETVKAVNDVAHGRLREALHHVANAGTDLAKAATEVQKTVVDAAADATIDLHLSKAMDKMAGNAKQMAAKMADNTVSAVDHIGHSLANNTATLVSDAGHLAGDVIRGDFNAAKHDLSKAGSDLGHAAGDLGKNAAEIVKTAVANVGEVGKCATDSAAAALKGLHISDSVDRFADKASHAIDKGINTTVQIGAQVADGVAKDLSGTVNGMVDMTKHVLNGEGGKALHDGLNTAMSAVSLACDLTPEGLAANAVMATMEKAHIGNEKVQNLVGDLVGGPKGLLKRAAEAGAGVGVGMALDKATNGHAETGLLAAGLLAPAAADLLGGRRGGHGATAHPEAPAAHHPHGCGSAPGHTHGPEAKTEAKPEHQAGTPAPGRNWHEVLGVGPDATRGQINQAYRKLSLQHHPDKGGNVEKQKEINNARDTALADLEQRPKTTIGGEPKTEAKPETRQQTQPESKPTPKPAADPAVGQPASKSATQPDTTGRDVKPDQPALQIVQSNSTQVSPGSNSPETLHTRSALQVSSASTAAPAPREEQAPKPKDNSLADSAGNVAGSAANVAGSAGNVAGTAGAVAGTSAALAGSAESAAAIAAAQASAAITIAAQTAMTAISNQIALNEARDHVSAQTGKSATALSR